MTHAMGRSEFKRAVLEALPGLKWTFSRKGGLDATGHALGQPNKSRRDTHKGREILLKCFVHQDVLGGHISVLVARWRPADPRRVAASVTGATITEAFAKALERLQRKAQDRRAESLRLSQFADDYFMLAARLRGAVAK